MLPYEIYEAAHAALAPSRAAAALGRAALWLTPLPYLAPQVADGAAAWLSMYERLTRRYAKPSFGIGRVAVGGVPHAVREEVVWSSPFCRLVRFAKEASPGRDVADPGPRLLLVAPLSGHHATLLRGTVEAMLPGCDVHVTDWTDARLVPPSAGRFDLSSYAVHVRDMLRHLGPGSHVMAVCQPAVPVLAAVALMAEDGEAAAPRSMTLMAGPIDTRVSPTAVNRLATGKGIAWFRDNAIATVPCPNAGAGRRVYPGYAQLAGFVSMNPERHAEAHRSMFLEMASGDFASAARRESFYDEYLSVIDLTEEFYLETVESVFIRHDLPLGRMRVDGRLVDPGAIRGTALMTVEGERDDITGIGQTEAAHALCGAIPEAMRVHLLQEGVGHYGVFSGSRFASEIAPRVLAFVAAHDRPSLPLAA